MPDLLATLQRPRGDRRWDLFLRATAAAALLGILALLAFPELAPLVWLAVMSLPANSPLSPILPTAFEPLIMDVAKHAAPLAVTLVALVGYMYSEYLNWHIYEWVLRWNRLAALQSRPWVRRSVAWFHRAPFATIVVFAFTPLPFWAVRVLALLGSYPLSRFMAATAVGRFPRLLFYAWLGDVLQVPTVALIAVVVGTTGIVVATRLGRGEAVLAETVLDEARAAGPKG